MFFKVSTGDTFLALWIYRHQKHRDDYTNVRRIAIQGTGIVKMAGQDLYVRFGLPNKRNSGLAQTIPDSNFIRY
jgi:hypothetical protein